MESNTRVPVYISPIFARLWVGGAISVLGDIVFDITLVLWIATDLAAGRSWAPLAVSGALIAATVPIVALGPLAGIYVDRWDKRRTMIAMDALRAALIGLLLAIVWIAPHLADSSGARTVDLVAVYAIVFICSACAQLFSPSRMALLSYIFQGETRTRASSLLQTTGHLATIVGPPLAGPLFFAVGARFALLINGLSFVGSMLAIASVPHIDTRAVRPAGAARGAWHEFLEGIHFYRHNRTLMTILVSVVIGMIGAGALNALDVFFVTGNLHAPASQYGFLAGAMGIGAVIGAVLTTIWLTRLGTARVFWASLLVVGVGIVVYSRTSNMLEAVVILFLAGVPMAALNVAVTPLMLDVTPRELVGRVDAVLNPAVNAATLLSLAVSGWIAGTILAGFHAHVAGLTFGAIDSLFAAAGVLCILGAIYAMLRFRTAPPVACDGTAAGDQSSSAA
jgi:MFS family permease